VNALIIASVAALAAGCATPGASGAAAPASGGLATIQLAGGDSQGRGVAFSADGKLVAASGAVWDLSAPGQPRVKLPLGACRMPLAFSTDGKFLDCSDGYVAGVDLVTGKAMSHLKKTDGFGGSAAVSLDGSLLAARSREAGGGIPIFTTGDWSVATRVATTVIPAPTVAAFSPDGQSLATMSIYQCKAQAWSAIEGKELWSASICANQKEALSNRALVWAKGVVLVGGVKLLVLDPASGRELMSRGGFEPFDIFVSVAVSPSGKYFAAGTLNGVFLFKSGSLEPIWRSEKRFGGTPCGVAFSPDEKYLAYPGSKTAELLPLELIRL
jgi:WD40 repeat protein